MILLSRGPKITRIELGVVDLRNKWLMSKSEKPFPFWLDAYAPIKDTQTGKLDLFFVKSIFISRKYWR